MLPTDRQFGFLWMHFSLLNLAQDFIYAYQGDIAGLDLCHSSSGQQPQLPVSLVSDVIAACGTFPF